MLSSQDRVIDYRLGAGNAVAVDADAGGRLARNWITSDGRQAKAKKQGWQELSQGFNEL